MLIVCGEYPNYDDDKTDVFDITNFIKNHCIFYSTNMTSNNSKRDSYDTF